MEEMIKNGAALQEPQLLVAVSVPVTVYVGSFASWLTCIISSCFGQLENQILLSHKLF